MARTAPTNWRSIAASCTIGILVGAGTINYTIIGQVAENRTLLASVRRDVDLQREDFREQQKTFRDFIGLLREQNVLLTQMIGKTNKP